MKINDSELILNTDGSVYHLGLLPADIAETILLVGDQNRVTTISKHFDSIEIKKGNREFITHTGLIGNKRITVLSTGIGTDNIDIVLNELNFLVNFDLSTRQKKTQKGRLKIIRIGTSGSLQEYIPVDSILVSSYGLGLDVLMHYYPTLKDKYNEELESLIANSLQIPFLRPYLFPCSGPLYELFNDQPSGITATCSGFYAPQGRAIGVNSSIPNLIDRLTNFKHKQIAITNFEMETAGIYGLAHLFGFEAISINAIVANRITQEFSVDGHKMIEKTITYVLNKLR